MVSKPELLKDLRDRFNFEEELVRKLSDFYKAIGWRSVVDKKHHKKIEQELTLLKEDSEKHAKIIQGMIGYVESCGKYEF